MASRWKLLGYNFHQLTIADGSYNPVTPVTRGGPMKVRASGILSGGRLKLANFCRKTSVGSLELTKKLTPIGFWANIRRASG
jgi:hypothetical protein